MPHFRYRAYETTGQLSEGTIDAVSQEAASDLLWMQGLAPFDMRQSDASAEKWWQRDLFLARPPSTSDLALFTRDFATLNSAEIPLDDALRTLADQAASAKLRALAKSLLADVLGGAPLSEAMSRNPRVFPPDHISAVQAGEVGGTLAKVFEELAGLLERRSEVRARVRSALLYPAVLIVLAIVSLTIVIGVLVPSIARSSPRAGSRHRSRCNS